MTALHADNLSASIRERTEAFEAAQRAGDWTTAWGLWLKMLHHADTVISESRAARIEAEAIATELQRFRPHRADIEPAPEVPGHVYVFTASVPWACVAVELRQVVTHQACHGAYQQEHYVPERKTVCGKKTAFPVNERFASGGWPRLCEVCPECFKALVAAHLSLVPGA